jgi:hypothetical protein
MVPSQRESKQRKEETVLFCLCHRNFMPLLQLTKANFIKYLAEFHKEHERLIFNILSNVFTHLEHSSAPPRVIVKEFRLRKEDHPTLSEEMVPRLSGFILASVIYYYLQIEHSYLSNDTLSEGCQEEFARRRHLLFEQFGDLIEPLRLIDSEIHYLVNYVFALEWMYQNVYNYGKKINSEYILIAGMVFEGSNRLYSRGGGSGPGRKVREEIFRRITGTQRQIRCRKLQVDATVLSASEEEEEESEAERRSKKRQREGKCGADETMLKEERKESGVSEITEIYSLKNDLTPISNV